MNNLPQVCKGNTADLRDVHKRLSKSMLFSYWTTFYTGQYARIYPWLHQFFPLYF
jgi:hypothetical protein